jgi:hypothetical protein
LKYHLPRYGSKKDTFLTSAIQIFPFSRILRAHAFKAIQLGFKLLLKGEKLGKNDDMKKEEIRQKEVIR